MRVRGLKLAAVTLAVLLGSWTPVTSPTIVASVPTMPLGSIGTLAFNADGVLFAADPQNAQIHAFDMGRGGAVISGPADVEGLDGKIAALLGTAPAEIVVTDMVVHPRTKHAYVAVMRGQGAAAAPALLRVDGAGKLELVALETVKHTKVDLPNAPAANPSAPRNPRSQSITDMAFVDGRLIVAGLSNEEFASKLRSIPYPFVSVENGTSVEIYHGNHGQLETRAPVFAFVPYTIGSDPHLIAAYTCTPLVKFPLATLKGSAKVVGTTIAELGNRNRPLDMVVYKKGGADFILMANNSRGVMKIPTAPFGTAVPITSRVADAETAGVPFEKVDALNGVEQLDLLDPQRSVIVARSETGLALKTIPLP